MAKGKKRARKPTPTNIIDGDGHNDPDEVSCSHCDTVIEANKEVQCKTCRCYYHHI